MVWRIPQEKVIKPLAGVCAVIAVVIVGSHLLVLPVLKMHFMRLKGSKAEMLSLPYAADGQSLCAIQMRLDEEDRAEMEQFFRKDWLTRYKYYLSDPVKRYEHGTGRG